MTALASSTRQSNVWWLFLLQGIAAIILGLMLITAPGATLLVMVTFLGFYWLIEGDIGAGAHLCGSQDTVDMVSSRRNCRHRRRNSRGAGILFSLR